MSKLYAVITQPCAPSLLENILLGFHWEKSKATAFLEAQIQISITHGARHRRVPPQGMSYTHLLQRSSTDKLPPSSSSS